MLKTSNHIIIILILITQWSPSLSPCFWLLSVEVLVSTDRSKTVETKQLLCVWCWGRPSPAGLHTCVVLMRTREGSKTWTKGDSGRLWKGCVHVSQGHRVIFVKLYQETLKFAFVCLWGLLILFGNKKLVLLSWHSPSSSGVSVTLHLPLSLWRSLLPTALLHTTYHPESCLNTNRGRRFKKPPGQQTVRCC